MKPSGRIKASDKIEKPGADTGSQSEQRIPQTNLPSLGHSEEAPIGPAVPGAPGGVRENPASGRVWNSKVVSRTPTSIRGGSEEDAAQTRSTLRGGEFHEEGFLLRDRADPSGATASRGKAPRERPRAREPPAESEAYEKQA